MRAKVIERKRESDYDIKLKEIKREILCEIFYLSSFMFKVRI